ncbi:hypothetical protein D9613_003499 [Agrocybe pediades]|uniref:Shugoshin C-terminal domain-containing protein n=1 Tax=Agrocybe pediades TaxID=84607 RepID=A0A8H4QPD7_9AGAR|nr:hypothetical protein D9613_003499 [Agrocybe pediades]
MPFKKKFLLANKHITKLNSTLSVRIEELNAQISMLYVENLRLRASEIALASQLKREREKSWKVLADAEAASQNLMKHLMYLRETHNVKYAPETAPTTPPSPRAKRPPMLDVENGSPILNRVSRPPEVPGIMEDDEPSESSADLEKQTTPPRKKPKAKPRLSASKLPLPTRGPSLLPPSTDATAFDQATDEAVSVAPKPRKTIRRQSGLLSVNTEALSVPRSASPAFGSPVRLEAGRAEEAEEFAAVHGELDLTGIYQDTEQQENYAAPTPKKESKRKSKTKEQRESESERDVGESSSKHKEKTRLREHDEVDSSEILKPKVKEITIPRTALQPIDSNVHEQVDEAKLASTRQFLRPTSPAGSAPTSRGSSSPVPDSEGNQNALGSRERRARKSVNYAEPKLNTKMRKPDPPPGSEPVRKKRSSAAAVMTHNTYKPSSTLSSTSSHSNRGLDTGNDADGDTEARSSVELSSPNNAGPLPLRGSSGNYIDPENFPLPPSSRPGSAAAMYSPGPPTRTTGSTTSGSTVSSSSSIATSSAASMKRKKSRPQLMLSDEEDLSDGAEADEEYVGSRRNSDTGSWVNVEGRRKALPKRSAAAAAVAALEDIRRHSMAI